VDLESFYLDYNATSPLSQSVKSWLASGDELFANPSSQHSAGKKSRKVINESRSYLFNLFKLDAVSDKLFFHSGATEGTYSITHSLVNFARTHKKKILLCSSPIDHPAVTNLKETFWGADVCFFSLKLKSDLSYDHEVNFLELKEFKKNHPESIILYHHLWVHNETGMISDLHELKRFKEIPELFVHVDGVQSIGKILEWNQLSFGDAFTFSGHKFGSIKGIGFTVLKKSFPFFTPLFLAGGQQSGLRGGTENPLGVKTLCLALEDLKKIDIEKNFKLKKDFENFLKQELVGIGEVISHSHSNANTIYFYLHELTSDVALAMFDLHGLMISAGSACSSGASKPSLVLTELGKKNVAKNGLRISFGFDLSNEYMETLKLKFLVPLKKLKKTK